MPYEMERKQPGSVDLNWEATAIMEENSYLREIETLLWRVATKLFLKISLVLLLATEDLDSQVCNIKLFLNNIYLLVNIPEGN